MVRRDALMVMRGELTDLKRRDEKVGRTLVPPFCVGGQLNKFSFLKMGIYVYWMLLVVLLTVLVGLVWSLSLSIPQGDNPWVWLWTNRYSGMCLYLIVVGAILIVSLLSFMAPGVPKFPAPLSQSGLFIFTATCLLLISFYVESTDSVRYIDDHPLVFYTAAGCLIMSLITAAVNGHKGLSLSYDQS